MSSGALFFANLAGTFAVYSLPIFIYRYAIEKKPVEKKLALEITIIYAIIAFVIMAVIMYALGSGAPRYAILLWAFVNYMVLKSGGSNEYTVSAKTAAAEPEKVDAPVQSSPAAPMQEATVNEDHAKDSAELLYQLQHQPEPKSAPAPTTTQALAKRYPTSAKIIIGVLLCCVVAAGLVCYNVGEKNGSATASQEASEEGWAYYIGFVDGINNGVSVGGTNSDEAIAALSAENLHSSIKSGSSISDVRRTLKENGYSCTFGTSVN